MKILIFTFLVYIVVNIACCSDSATTPVKNGLDSTLNYDYDIYYSLNQKLGFRPEHSGLFRFDYLNSDYPVRVLTETIEHTSSVASNGSLVFYYNNLNPKKFWTWHTEGTSLQIDLPVSSQTGLDYDFEIPPYIEISGDGSKAVYFASLERLDETKPEENNQNIIVASLSGSLLEKYSIRDFYTENLKNQGVDFALPFGNFFTVNKDASEICFVLKCMSFTSGIFTDLGFTIIKLENGIFKRLCELQSDTLRIAGVDQISGKLFVYLGNNLKTLSNLKFSDTPLEFDSMINPNSFAVIKQEIVVWSETGIDLYNPISGTKISEVISWDSIKVNCPDVHLKGTKFLSISPDAGLITFALRKLHTDDAPVFDLYAIRRNGTGLKNVISKIPIGYPVISYGFKK